MLGSAALRGQSAASRASDSRATLVGASGSPGARLAAKGGRCWRAAGRWLAPAGRRRPLSAARASAPS